MDEDAAEDEVVAAQHVAKGITDMHAHVGCLTRRTERDGDPGDECMVSQEMRNDFKFKHYLEGFGVTEEKILSNPFATFDTLVAKLKSSSRVRRAVVLALDAWVDRTTGQVVPEKTQLYVPNRFVLEGIRRKESEGLFHFGASINPYRRDAIARLEQAKRDGAVLIKWIPNTMNIDPSDPAIIPFYEKLKELELPLLVHTGNEATFAWADNALADPVRLEVPLRLGVTIIAAHVATSGKIDGQKNYDRLKVLFDKEEYRGRLFADISATTQFNRVKAFKPFIEDDAFRGRLLYGTDWPLIDVELKGVAIIPFFLYATPLYGNVISLRQAKEIHALTSSFDRDVRLKEMLGAGPEVFTQSEKVLHLSSAGR